MNAEQYKLVWARRVALDTRVWQTPSLAVAAQAFLVAPAFRVDTPAAAAALLAGTAAVVGLAAVQLMAKLRYLESTDAELLLMFEQANGEHAFESLNAPGREPVVRQTWLARPSSYAIWRTVLFGFVLLSIYAMVVALVR